MSEIAEVIQITESRFNSIAPKWMKYDAEKGFAIQILNNNDYLKQAANSQPASLQQAITNVAAIGLSLNPAEKLAYLIPRNIKIKDENGKDKWVTRVYLEPSYMGLCRLATDSGSIDWIQADVVHANDTFIYNGPGKEVTHIIKGDNAFTADRGDMVGVYCTAKTAKGDFLGTLMPMSEVVGIRDRSEAWKSYKAGKTKTGGPWESDFNEQAKKTVVRRAFKMWPRSDERRMERLSQAVHLSNENEGFEPLISSPRYGEYTADQKSYFDQLIEQGDALGMHCFMDSFGHDASSQEASVKVSLMHSFPKGQKGRYQQIVDDLRAKGQSQYIDLENAILDAIQQGDDLAIKETLSELSDDVVLFIKNKLSHENLQALEDLCKP